MIYILAGIVVACALIGVAGLLEKLWDRLENHPTRKEEMK